MGDNPHAGHRKRLKERFLMSGLDSFPDHNVLELLLFFGKAQGDTNETAHRLMEAFGSFSGVFDASYEELIKVKDVGPVTATLIKLIPAMGRRYLDDKNTIGTLVAGTESCGKFLLPKFIGEMSELVYLLCLDNKNKVLGCPLVCRGDVVGVDFTPRRVVEEALKLSATAVVLAHNHPRGHALPSEHDITTTRELFDTLARVNIRLLDHIIVSGEEFVSLADSGLFYRR